MKFKEKQYAILGLGRFGSNVAIQLEKDGFKVLAVDISQEKVNKISDSVTHAICLDIKNEELLNEIGLENFDVVIISIGNSLEASIFATIKAKECGAKKVIVKAYDDFQGKILQKVGADKIIYPEKEMAIHLAKSLEFNNLIESTEIGDGYSIVEIIPLKEWTGKTIAELNLREKYNFNIIAIKTKGNIEVNPHAKRKIGSYDNLVILGPNKTIEKFVKNIKGN